MASVSLTVIGDVAFGGPLSADPSASVGRIPRDLLDALKADVVLANLECVLSDDVQPGKGSYGPLPMFAPTRTTEALRRLGIDAVSLANNHVMDYGAGALRSTIRALDAAGIAHTGAGKDLAEAGRAAILERNGLRVGILGFGAPRRATRYRAGALCLDDGHSRKLIRDLRARCDFLVVYFHEGIEAYSYPMKSTVQACHGAAECGAGLVVGSHPHTIQGIERYQGVPIVYSLGNFIIPMLLPERYEKWRQQTSLTLLGVPFEKRLISQALVLQCTFSPGKAPQLAPVPIVVSDEGLPRLADAEEARAAEAFLRELSGAFDRPDDPIWRQRDRIEAGFNRLALGTISWKYILRNLWHLRPRHIRWLLSKIIFRRAPRG